MDFAELTGEMSTLIHDLTALRERFESFSRRLRSLRPDASPLEEDADPDPDAVTHLLRTVDCIVVDRLAPATLELLDALREYSEDLPGEIA